MAKYWMYPEWVSQEAIDVTCDPEALGFADLSVTPVAFGQKSHQFVNDIYWAWNQNTETNREAINA